MLKYLKDSFRRKIARLITKEYPPKIDTFYLKDIGTIEFANWDNPLVTPYKMNGELIAFFRQFIKPGSFAIDIGANIGDTTVPISLCTGVSGLTLGFDPNPCVFKILQKNASLNKDKTNIVPVPFAISQKEEEFYFVSSEASFGNGGISPTKKSLHGKYVYPQKIKGVNLKNYLEENCREWLPKLSFIKIDAEGYDKEILKSIRDLITAYRPIIIAESFAEASDAEKTELYEIIEAPGYDIYYFENFTITAKVQKLSHKSDLANYKENINVYALPRA